MTIGPLDLVAAALIGLAAGLIGGLAGIGGSVIMLPGMAWAFGYPDGDYSRHHLYMAAAMVVNVVVSIPAALRHHREKAIQFNVLKKLLAPMLIGVVSGVFVSNMVDGRWLKIMLAGFIVVYCITNLVRVARRHNESHEEALVPRSSTAVIVAIGTFVGFTAGLLGLGGGVLLVPLLQMGARLRLRHAIATSSALLGVSAIIGALLKVGTLYLHHLTMTDALLLSAAMAPTAAIGARLGAPLTHKLPIMWVRIVITALLLVAAARMADLWGGGPVVEQTPQDAGALESDDAEASSVPEEGSPTTSPAPGAG